MLAGCELTAKFVLLLSLASSPKRARQGLFQMQFVLLELPAFDDEEKGADLLFTHSGHATAVWKGDGFIIENWRPSAPEREGGGEFL